MVPVALRPLMMAGFWIFGPNPPHTKTDWEFWELVIVLTFETAALHLASCTAQLIVVPPPTNRAAFSRRSSSSHELMRATVRRPSPSNSCCCRSGKSANKKRERKNSSVVCNNWVNVWQGWSRTVLRSRDFLAGLGLKVRLRLHLRWKRKLFEHWFKSN